MKRNGFASLDAFQDASESIDAVLEGVDPQTKTYVGVTPLLRKQLAALEADTTLPAKDKAAAVKELKGAIAAGEPGGKPPEGNIALVTQNYDRLNAALGPDAGVTRRRRPREPVRHLPTGRPAENRPRGEGGGRDPGAMAGRVSAWERSGRRVPFRTDPSPTPHHKRRDSRARPFHAWRSQGIAIVTSSPRPIPAARHPRPGPPGRDRALPSSSESSR